MKLIKRIFYFCLCLTLCCTMMSCGNSSSSGDEDAAIPAIQASLKSEEWRLPKSQEDTSWTPEYSISLNDEAIIEASEDTPDVTWKITTLDNTDLDSSYNDDGTLSVVFKDVPQSEKPFSVTANGRALELPALEVRDWARLVNSTDDSLNLLYSAYAWTSAMVPNPKYAEYGVNYPKKIRVYNPIVMEDYTKTYLELPDYMDATPDITACEMGLDTDSKMNCLDNAYFATANIVVGGKFAEINFNNPTHGPIGINSNECLEGYTLSTNSNLCVLDARDVVTEDILDNDQNKIGEKYYRYGYITLTVVWSKTVTDDKGFTSTGKSEEYTMYVQVKSEKINLDAE